MRFKKTFIYIGMIVTIFIAFKTMPLVLHWILFEAHWKLQLITFILGYLIVIPHEYLHKVGASLMGIKGSIKFNLLGGCFIPRGNLNYKQLIVMASTPLVILTSFFAILIASAYYLNIRDLYYFSWCLLIISAISSLSDAWYIIYALIYRKSIFKDEGHTLVRVEG